MTVDVIMAGLAALGLLGYLGYALWCAEKF
ncbi:MAG: potassium-transporting ATPase subunit F [SAR324 cluster bacterium]|nr:potassium-transporting ATPase subunit F [SAR324 cluster bacterium]